MTSNTVDAAGLTSATGAGADASPSPKQQRTSTESHLAPSHFAPSQPLLSHMQASPYQSAYDITRQILDTAGGSRGSTSDEPAPAATSVPSSALAPQQSTVQGPESAMMSAEARPPRSPSQFKMKRTGTGVFPGKYPVSKKPAPKVTVAPRSEASPSTPDNWASPPSGKPTPESVAEFQPVVSDIVAPETAQTQRVDRLGLDASPPPRPSSANPVMAPSETARSGAAGDGTVPTRQSLAMKRKWASGEMDHVGRKAAETRRQNIERRISADAERRKSVISVSDNSTPVSPAPTSTPNPTSTAAKKPTLADYYRKRVSRAAEDPTWREESPASAVVSTPASPQLDTPKLTADANDSIATPRPDTLPPKKRARKSSSFRAPNLPIPATTFARSLSGRPYDMVPKENGRHVHGFGALFPDGYAPLPDEDGKGPRWICPVMGCIHERTYLKSHGKHFLTVHKDCLLNDNGDGTFTVVGYNDQLDAAMVVSRDPKERAVPEPSDDLYDVPVEKPQVSSVPPAHGPAGGHQGILLGDVSNTFGRTPSGRPYSRFPDRGGRTNGIPIPDGYERLVTSAETPWVCPVSNCLASFANLHGLTTHFARKHGASLFNDNLDGTISLLCRREDDARYRSLPGYHERENIVARQGPLESAEEWQVSKDNVKKTPSQPNSTPTPGPGEEDKARPTQKPQRSIFTGTPLTPSQARPSSHYLTPVFNAQPVANLQGNALELWNYIRPFLSEISECPDSAFIPELLKLPKVRDIVWDDAYIAANGFKERLTRDVATLIIQITGEPPPNPCSRCRDHKGPYGECIAISPEAPIDARLTFQSCASCTYNGQGTYCTAKFWGKKRATDAAAAMRAATRDHQDDAGPVESSMPIPSTQSAQNQGMSPTRRSERVQVKEATVQGGYSSGLATASRTVMDADDGPYEEAPAPRPSSSPLSSPPPTANSQIFQLRRKAHSRLNEPAKFHPANTSNMAIEDWELAPGRLQSAAAVEPGERPETIAFSQPYLAANQSVPVAQDATFRVSVVSPGSSVRFAAAPDRVRVCSVGAGKVKVRMQGEDEFELGPHGMFRVLRGRSCVVLNRLYGDAVLHVTEVADYS